jgi:hypothetical protein
MVGKVKKITGILSFSLLNSAATLSSPDSLENIILQKDRSTLFLVYGSGSDTGAIVCQELVKKGILYVYLLSQGLYHFVWSTANIEDCKAGREFLVNHEGLY